MIIKKVQSLSNQVEKNLIKRLLNNSIHEALLPYSIKENMLMIPLKRSNKIIVASDITNHHLQNVTIHGEVSLISQGRIKIIKTLRHLLKLIHYELEELVEKSQWKKFVTEIENCYQNGVLVAKFVKNFNRKLIDRIKKTERKTLIDFISRYSIDEQLMFFESWATKGHPYHPCHKTKLGFDKKSYLKFSPEFSQDIHLPVAAIAKSDINLSAEQNDFDYNKWFAERYPLVWQCYREKISDLKLSENSYCPIFIHPWQYENILTKLFSDMIEKRHLILFNDVLIKAKASLSFRTLITKDSRQPHIKLPISVYSTSAMRTISPASVHNGPLFSRILKQILERENYFSGYIKFCYETCGFHVKHEQPEIAKCLGIIYRENPAHFINDKQIPIVIAALFEKSPVTQLPLFIEMMQPAIGNRLTGVIDYFNHYARMIMCTYFDLFLIYGIALEGHQQNTIAVFENNVPAFMIARDFGGIRIHLPTLKQMGFDFEPHAHSATVTHDAQEVTNKFLHSVIQCHLGEIALLLSQHFETSEDVFWKVIKDNLALRFQELKNKVEPSRWQRERNSIMENDWQVKGLMRMRLNDLYNKYIYVNLSNPLRAI